MTERPRPHPPFLAAVLTALTLWLAPQAANAADARSFAAWITGEWADPKVHTCGEVWIRIEADAGEVVVHTLTFGNPVFASRSTILSITEDGRARIDNHTLTVEQQIRFAGEDAHVLEKPSRAGGVTFVRCPDAPERAFAPMQSETPGETPPARPTSPPAGDG